MRWERWVGIAASAWLLSGCAAQMDNDRYAYGNGFTGTWQLDASHSDMNGRNGNGGRGWNDRDNRRSNDAWNGDQGNGSGYSGSPSSGYGNGNGYRDGRDYEADSSEGGPSNTRRAYGNQDYGSGDMNDRGTMGTNGYDRDQDRTGNGGGWRGARAGMLPDVIRIDIDRGQFRIEDANGMVVEDVTLSGRHRDQDWDANGYQQGSYRDDRGAVSATGQWSGSRRVRIDPTVIGDRNVTQTLSLDDRDRLIVVTTVTGDRGTRTFTNVYTRSS